MSEDELVDVAAASVVTMARLGHRPELLWSLDSTSCVVMCLTCRDYVRWWRHPDGWWPDGLGVVAIAACGGELGLGVRHSQA